MVKASRKMGMFSAVLCLAGSAFAGSVCAAKADAGYGLERVSWRQVDVAGGFWESRLETNRRVTVWHTLRQCEKTGRIENFARAGNLLEGKFEGTFFNDSDVYKVLEGAAYVLGKNEDAVLEAYVDGVIDKIAAAQWEDGYLYTSYSIPQRQPAKQWTGCRWAHELYCAGHLFEAAAAYYQATGKRKFLDVAVKLADHIDSVFGPARKRDVPGHEEIELALVRLYEVTGQRRYLELARFFVAERGQAHGRQLYGEYHQDHKPVLEQDEPVGHAVRAAYLYAGMVDVGAMTGDGRYVEAAKRIWENVVSKKLYLTAGIGAQHDGESFGTDYELPNATAYCETCAAIANAFWNYRLFLLEGQGKYLDVFEQVLYNGFLAGVSMSGNKFFYRNPLEWDGLYKFNADGTGLRQGWFGCACCPTNIVRFMGRLGGYVYARRAEDIYVNLFVSGRGRIETIGGTVRLRQETRYPWDGKVRITIELEQPEEFAIFIRVPGWARNRPLPGDLYHYMKPRQEQVSFAINGTFVEPIVKKGFACIRRRWQARDVVEVEFQMAVRRVLCYEKVEANRGKVALQRGPIVYCAEWIDNNGSVFNLVLPDDRRLWAEYRENMLGGVTVIGGRVRAAVSGGAGQAMVQEERGFTAIPYYAWGHRGAGEMAVWLARQVDGSSE